MDSDEQIDTQILGIHHVTAIAGDPQKNLDFYSGLLSLRLVKLTINFDDPTTYHLGPARRFGDQVLSLRAPDGLRVELVAHAPSEEWDTMPTGMLPSEHEIRGFHSVTLWEEGYEQTAQLLTRELGFRAPEMSRTYSAM